MTAAPTRRPARRRFLPLAVLLVLTAPVAVWWVVGDMSIEGSDLDYSVRPPDWDPAVQNAVGITATVVFVVVAALLVHAGVTRRLDPLWWLALVPAVTAGAVAAVIERMLTAGTYGANIGAGLAVLAGVPVVVVLLTISLVVTVLMARRRRRSADDG